MTPFHACDSPQELASLVASLLASLDGMQAQIEASLATGAPSQILAGYKRGLAVVAQNQAHAADLRA